jgi:phosphoribosyl 1,2-cyclic phosphodiesterase
LVTKVRCVVRVVSLGSGSDGNAILVRNDMTTVLVDAGFTVRELVSRLRQAQVRPEDISAILITHEHADHAGGARPFARQFGIPLIADPRTLNALCAQPERGMPGATAPERVELPVGHLLSWGKIDIASFPVSHDAIAPCGYVLSSAAWRVFVATDTGLVTDAMREAMRLAHLIIIEANHDHDRLLNGPYPWYLKQRILGPTGHLSNDQTKRALASVLDDGPRWLWLAHLSRTNNTPDLARACIREHLRQIGLRHIQPQPLPHAFGPTWDSASLWSSALASSPGDAAEPAPREDVRERR